MNKILLTVLLLAVLFTACDKGIAPREPGLEESGIQGTIFFQNWPPPDSLFDLRLVAFREFPPENIILEIVNQQAFAYPSINDSLGLPFYVERTDFEFELPAGQYGYLVVAQRYGENLFSDWRAVGQYDVDSDSLPSPLRVPENRMVRNIFISVDFDHLPIQPF